MEQDRQSRDGQSPAGANSGDGDRQLRWLSAISEVDAADWDGLFPGGNPFVRHAFLSSLEDSRSADAESGWAPRHLLIEEQGRPVAAMPLYEKTHSYGEFVFDWAWAEAWQRHGLSYYPKLLTAVPFTPSVGPRFGCDEDLNIRTAAGLLRDALLAEAERLNLSSWHILFADRACRDALQAGAPAGLLLRRQDVQFHFLNRDFGNFDDFLGSLRASRRKNMRKERRRVAAQGVTMERQTGAGITAQDWADFYRCYVATFLKRSGHAGYLTREFFELLRERMADQLMLVLARRDGRVVAGALFLFDSERLYGRWWGALEQVDCLHFETCFYQGMEFAIENGQQVFDPGTQGEHKLLRGFEPVTTHSLHYIRDERFRAAIADYLERERPHSEAYGEQAADFLPFRRDQPDNDQRGGATRPGRGGRNTS